MDLLGLLGQLIFDTSVSWVRMFIALGISVVLSFGIGILAATSKRAEKVILPVVDVLQTLPILAFFPFAIFIFVAVLPGYIGINAAVIFLIITSMLWNIIFGVYEAIKTVPNEFFEVAQLYDFDFWTRLKKLYIPACLPRVVEQSILSWAIGLFYLVTSEIFSIGTQNYQVKYGIGAWLVQNGPTAVGGSITNYLIGIAVFIVFVIATRMLFFKPLEDYSTRYMRADAKTTVHPVYERVLLDWINKGMKSRYIKRIHTATKDIKIVKHPIRHRVYEYNEKKSRFNLYYMLGGVALAAIVVYLFLSYPVLLQDESQVLPALALSFTRVWLAFLVIVLVSVPLCVYIVFFSKQGSKYMIFFQVIASVPATILLPLIAVGLQNAPFHGELVAFVIFVLSGIWYMVFSMVASTRTLPNSIFEVQKLFGVKGWRAWKEIYIKALMPGFITGALTAIAAEWNASIVAEYFTTSGITGGSVTTSVSVGIGKLLDTALAPGGQGLLLMALALLNLVVMILIINTFVWKRAYRNVAKVYG